MVFFSSLFQGQILCDSIYDMFDEDKSGSMDFSENMQVKGNAGKLPYFCRLCSQAKMAMELGTPDEKLGWIFEFFDADGGGTVCRVFKYQLIVA